MNLMWRRALMGPPYPVLLHDYVSADERKAAVAVIAIEPAVLSQVEAEQDRLVGEASGDRTPTVFDLLVRRFPCPARPETA